MSGKWQKKGPMAHTLVIWPLLSHPSQIFFFFFLDTHDESVQWKGIPKWEGGIKRMRGKRMKYPPYNQLFRAVFSFSLTLSHSLRNFFFAHTPCKQTTTTNHIGHDQGTHAPVFVLDERIVSNVSDHHCLVVSAVVVVEVTHRPQLVDDNPWIQNS